MKLEHASKTDALRAAQAFNYIVYAYHMNNLSFEHDEKMKRKAAGFPVSVVFEGIGLEGKRK